MTVAPAPPDPLFPGWDALSVPLDDGMFYCRVSGPVGAPALLLLHGYPQTGAMWAPVAARLATAGRWRLVVPDLPGYGASRLAATDPERMRKRRLAADMAVAMTALGHPRFSVAGHDRGGRVAYRLAFDRPERLERVSVLDITPTLTYWDGCGDRAFAVKIFHWMMLAQPYPVPEQMIGAAPEAYLDGLIASWTAAGDLSAFAPEALAAYRAQMADPGRCKALCDDYRAGATGDAEDDEADRAAGAKIAPPLLALWGDAGIARQSRSVRDVWTDWASDVTGAPIACGHFLPEERPDETADALAAFFAP